MYKPPFIRSAYNYDMDHATAEDPTTTIEPGESITQQEFAKESDINYIAERYGLTGTMPQVLDLPRYGDFSGVYDFATANQVIIDANKSFMELPAKLRARFQNNPQALLEFMSDPDNYEEAVALKLVDAKTTTATTMGDTPPKPKETPTGKGEETPPPPKPVTT